MQTPEPTEQVQGDAALVEAPGPSSARESRRHPRRKLIVAFVLLLVAISARVSVPGTQAALAAPLTNYSSGATERGTFWYVCTLVPIGYPEHAAGTVWYTPYAGTPGWDYVYQDTQLTYITNGQYAGDPCPIGPWTFIDYYQQGYNFVIAYAGQYYISNSHPVQDAVLYVGDHNNRSFYVVMHALHVPGATQLGSGCCGQDDAPYWVK